MNIDIKKLASGEWIKISEGRIDGNDIDISKDGWVLDKSFLRTVKFRTPAFDEFAIWDEHAVLQVEYDYDADKTLVRLFKA